MLSLDDARWSKLTHAYGAADDSPQLLGQIARSTKPVENPRAEPWFSLWSSLCHQGDAYDASYAALPHIVDIACEAEGAIDFNFLLLPAAIEVARSNGRGPLVPPDLWSAYEGGVSRLVECVALHRHDRWDQNMLFAALAAQAAAKGNPRVAEALMNLDESLVTKLIDLDF